MQNLGMKTVQTHSEKAAAYMADGYARAKRGPGLCMSQSVGAMNLASGLLDAYLAHSPVIAITGREAQADQARNAYQEVDHVNPFLAVSKASTYVASPDQLPLRLRQAFREAVSGTPGPVHIDVEGRTGSETYNVEADMEVIVEKQFSSVPPFRPVADADSIKAALKLLAEAKRPAIIAGGGVTTSDARAELIALAEKLSIPVATALHAKAMFPFDHPLALGIPGVYSKAWTNKFLVEADLIFFIGSHTGNQVTADYKIPVPGVTTIQLNIEAAEIGRNFPISAGLHGDAKATLRAMIEAAEKAPPRKAWLQRKDELRAAFYAERGHFINSEELPMRPERLCREISENLPSNAILVSDTGHSGIWTGSYIDLKHEGQSYYRCAGSLGWGVPGSMGIKCAAPDRPVVCFTGDGGLWYHLLELDTARRHGINTVTIVNNNHSLNQERGGNERDAGNGKRTAQSDYFWLFPETDFAKLAEGMGCVGIVVNKPDEVAGALERAFAADKPVLIDVRTDVEGIAPRVWTPA
jgi:acetolactate synthase-1/2/3 large subunit